MSWNTLRAHAKRMGFEVVFSIRRDEAGGFVPELTPPEGSGWVLVGSYEHIAGLWVKPVTNTARKLTSDMVRRLMAEGDPFVEEIGDYDVDFFNANAPFLTALQLKNREAQ